MIRVECDQYSSEWWSARCGIPTASEFARILTPKTLTMGAGAQSYINELIAQQFDPNYGLVEGYVSAAMKNGTIMEPEVRRTYEFEYDCHVEQVGFCLTDDRRFGCSPDGLIGDEGGVEIKSPNPATHVGYLRAGVLPEAYVMQVHGCLIVTGRKWWDFISHCPGTALPKFTVRVKPDGITEALRVGLEQFHEAYQKALTQITSQIPLEALVPSVPEYGELSSDYWA